MKFKLVALFNYVNDLGKSAGWSEVWYADASNSTAAATAFIPVLEKRAGCLGRSTSIIGYRVQEFGKRAFVVNRAFPPGLDVGQDIPQMALECKVYGTGVENVKFFQLRGVPDSLVVNGAYTPSQQFQFNLIAYGIALQASQIAFQCIDQTKPQVKILSITQDGNFVLAPGLTYDEGNTLSLLRTKNQIGQNVSGNYRIEQKTSNTVGKLQAWSKGPVLNNGKARVREYVYPIVVGNSLTGIQISTRKVGRSFFQYRGRVRNRT